MARSAMSQPGGFFVGRLSSPAAPTRGIAHQPHRRGVGVPRAPPPWAAPGRPGTDDARRQRHSLSGPWGFLGGSGFLAVTMMGGLAGIAPQCLNHASAIAQTTNPTATTAALIWRLPRGTIAHSCGNTSTLAMPNCLPAQRLL